MTLPEVLIWQRLKARRPAFRKQHPVGPYILDFYRASDRLCVEIDGQQHNGDHDTRRDAWLAEQGIRVVRIPAADVLRDPDSVAEYIVAL